MSTNEVKITHEALFDVLRIEKNKPELQPLDNDFYLTVAEYISNKQDYYNAHKGSFNEKESLAKELNNIKRIFTNIYFRRLKKIMKMSLDINYAPDTIVDKKSLLTEESTLFNLMKTSLGKYRSKNLDIILDGKTPKTEKINKPEQKKIQVEFLKDVPKFIGSDLVHYGPFQENDTAIIPMEMIDILQNNGSIKKIES